LINLSKKQFRVINRLYEVGINWKGFRYQRTSAGRLWKVEEQWQCVGPMHCHHWWHVRSYIITSEDKKWMDRFDLLVLFLPALAIRTTAISAKQRKMHSNALVLSLILSTNLLLSLLDLLFLFGWWWDSMSFNKDQRHFWKRNVLLLSFICCSQLGSATLKLLESYVGFVVALSYDGDITR